MASASKGGGLPFLPGYSSGSPTKMRHGRVAAFQYKNGYSIPKNMAQTSDKIEPLSSEELQDLAESTARMTYGDRARNSAGPAVPASSYIPAHVVFDKKVLLFTGYMKETVHESPLENYRVRYFKIYYYLEDDTISVSEPEVENSGMKQGAFLKRQRVPKNKEGGTYHWKDLNLGQNMVIYGKVLRITDCNEWTRQYLTKEGIEVNSPERAPEDPYLQTRLVVDQPDHTHDTPSDFDKMKQFLVLDRKVLRFYCVWDDRHNMFGELRSFILHYYLVDDTIEIREVHPPNDGRDPFPILLNRQCVPRNFKNVPIDFPSIVFETTENDNPDLINPADFEIGKTINILGRDFLLYDLDEFTKEFYRQNFDKTDEDFAPIDVALPEEIKPQPEVPPHTGIGSAEDSLLSCITIAPKAPSGTKSLPKLLKYDNKILRFKSHVENIEELKDRTFILNYRLADDHISVFEPTTPNSGTTQGLFLAPAQIQRPDCNPDMPEYLTTKDFYYGAAIEIFGKTFIIDDVDKFAVNFMEENPELFTEEGIAVSKEHFQQSQTDK
eukprot:m.224231 g.224231  ORF g.224231 m.224231 type:complete len:552 (+) comp15948_c0_seq8:136-1791(+)